MSIDPSALSSTQHYQVALHDEVQLNQDCKDCISPDYMFVFQLPWQSVRA